MQRILANIVIGSVIGSMAAASSALGAPVVNNIRLGQHPDHTRLVIDFSEAADYQLTPSADGRNLIIDLPGSTSAPNMADVKANGIIERVSRFERADGPGFRLVLDMQDPAAVSADFVLPPQDGLPFRLVIDLVDALPPPAVDPASPEPVVEAAVETAIEPTITDAPVITDALVDPVLEDTDDMPASTGGPVMMAGLDDDDDPFLADPLLDDAPEAIALDGVRQDWSGYIQGEVRLFPQSVPGKEQYDASIAIELTYEAAWNNGLQSITITPFARLDLEDSSRTHADIRELKWAGVFGDFEARVGIDQVFWGVTESLHLVDIINQTDGVEDIDEEDRLGQPLVSLSFSQSWGTVTGYVLPYFRERTFAGRDGRPGGSLHVADELAVFGSTHDTWRTDWALRYSHAIGPFDIGLAHFHGMGRDPVLVPTLVGDEIVLIPSYTPIDQSSFDLQATFGPMLLKAEGITVDSRNNILGDRYYAGVAGFEYTFFNALGHVGDIGLLAEYLWDERGDNATTAFEDDLFVGARFASADLASTEFLAGVIFDMDSSTMAANMEASQRLWDHWRISIDGRFFLNVADDDPLSTFSRGDFIQLRLERFF